MGLFHPPFGLLVILLGIFVFAIAEMDVGQFQISFGALIGF